MGGLLWKRRYRYNIKGDVAQERHYGTGNILRGKWRYTYDYDAAGNWIRRTKVKQVSNAETDFVEPSDITYRTFTYD